MAASERLRVLVAGTFTGALLVSACGMVTGLSDDYRYDLDASSSLPSGDGGTSGDGGKLPDGGNGGGPRDGSGPDGSSQCGVTDRTTAQTDLTVSGGDQIPTLCKNCLTGSCCIQIEGCFQNLECKTAMECVFGCQKDNGGGNKAQCLANCHNLQTFNDTVATCARNACAAPTCTLQ
jgi:hypothetical protein